MNLRARENIEAIIGTIIVAAIVAVWGWLMTGVKWS